MDSYNHSEYKINIVNNNEAWNEYTFLKRDIYLIDSKTNKCQLSLRFSNQL